MPKDQEEICLHSQPMPVGTDNDNSDSVHNLATAKQPEFQELLSQEAF